MKAGTLEIEMIANLSRLQQDLDQARKVVAAMGSDVGRTVNAANDNLASIGRGAGGGLGQLSREMSQLRAELDPIGVATARYNREVEMLNAAVERGKLTQREYAIAIEQARDRLDDSANRHSAFAVQAREMADAEADAARKAALAEREAAQAAAGYAAQAGLLRSQLDPMYLAQQRFNQTLDQAEDLLTREILTEREYVAVKKLATQALQDHARAVAGSNAGTTKTIGAMDAVTAATGSQRQGLQQLGMQGNDIITMWNLGAKPAQIFASQIGQVTQAVQLMAGGTSKFATFLGGPWGIALSLAVIALTPLISKLFQTADAADTARGALAKLAKEKADQREADNVEILSQQQIQNLYGQRVAVLRQIATAESILARTGPDVARQNGIDRLKAQVSKLTFDINTAEDLVAEKTKKGNALTDQAVENLAKLAGATTAVDRATAQHAVAIDRVNAAYAKSDKGTEAQAARLAGLTAANRALNEAQDVARAASGGRADQNRIATLGRETAAVEELIAGLYKTADAYLASSSAGMRAEIEARATEQGIKKRADVEAFVTQQMRKAIAERIAQGSQSIAAMRDETAVRDNLNQLVASGALSVEDAAKAQQMAARLHPLNIALMAAEGDERAKLTIITKEMQAALDAANVSETRAQDLAKASQVKLQTADVRLDIKLMKDLAAARAAAMSGAGGGNLAQIAADHQKIAIQARAEAEATQLIKEGYIDAAAAVMLKAEADKSQVDAGLAIDEQILALRELNGLFDEMADAAASAASIMADAFGDVGGAIGDVISILADYGAKQQEIKEQVIARTISQEKAERDLANLQLDSMGKALGAAKGLFKEHSTGYKAMAAAEKAFAIVQLANTAINIAAGAAKMFATLGPFGFPAVAAMVAVMAGLGAAVAGGGGGYKAPSAEDVQAGQGTGSVLGDSSAKSGSLGNALELMLKNSNKDLEYSSDMVRSLRAIETNIGALTGLLARQLNVSGGSFDTSGLGLGSKTSSGISDNVLGAMMGNAAFTLIAGVASPIALLAGMILPKIPIIGDLLGGIAKALFGTKKTVTLLDQGVVFAAQSVEDIVNGGLIGQIYQDVSTKTKKKMFGITTSNKTKVTTSYGDLDNDMERQVALIIGSLKSGILDAASVLGVQGAEAALNAFSVNLGKISLKDLTGDEIQEALEGVFGKLGDDMAAAVLPGLVAFQQVGEGVFETLARLAKDYATVDTALTSIGMTFGAVGMASVAAREGLIDLFGGLDAFVEQTTFFRENFLSEAEQMAPIISAVSAEMARLGHSGVTTKDQFKDLVLGLDLSTESGADMYASLMAVAPAFAKVIEYMGSLDAELGESGKTAEELAAIAKSRRGLEIELMDALGQSEEALAARRADALVAVDESNRALQEQVWAAQDAAEAASKLAATQEAIANQRTGLENQILQLQGDTNAQRERELASLDASLRPLQERIYALQDEAEATAAAAALTEQRLGLEGQIMQALGDTEGMRARELAALDASLRPLQERIYALQDEAEAAAKAKAVADERYGLETQLYQAIGDTATLRARELAGLDPANRALQQRIYAIEDQKAAEEAAVAARNTLIESYRNEASAIADTVQKFSAFAKGITDFRDGLLATANPAGNYAQIEARFNKTAQMAQFGNEASLASFTEDAKAYLDAATANAGSRDERDLALARVIAASNGAIGGATGVANMAASQLAAAEAAVAQLEALGSQASELDASIAALEKRQSEEVIPAVTETVETSVGKLRDEVVRLREEGADREDQMITILTAITVAVNKLQRDVAAVVDGDSVMVANRSDEPLVTTVQSGNVTVSGDVSVNNTAGNPVQVHSV